MKFRIVKKTNYDRETYTIQQKHFLFRWLWVDAWINYSMGAHCVDTFDSLEDAEKHLCYFDNSTSKIEVIKEYEY